MILMMKVMRMTLITMTMDHDYDACSGKQYSSKYDCYDDDDDTNFYRKAIQQQGWVGAEEGHLPRQPCQVIIVISINIIIIIFKAFIIHHHNCHYQDWEAQCPWNMEDGSQWVLRSHPGLIFTFSFTDPINIFTFTFYLWVWFSLSLFDVWFWQTTKTYDYIQTPDISFDD